jgi:hypothetical protein
MPEGFLALSSSRSFLMFLWVLASMGDT